MDTHIFAVYFSHLDSRQKDLLVIEDKDIISRIKNVLRLQVGEKIILFKSGIYGQFSILNLDKKGITLKTEFMSSVQEPKNLVTLNIGLLKKESFEEILYTATELGVNIIQPILSEKIHKNWWDNKFKDRFEKIIISAAEQAKNFTLPNLKEPVKFKDFLLQTGPNTLWFDVAGANILDALPALQTTNLDIIIGPEGDFSLNEKKALSDLKIKSVKLTPTVLRSVQAASVGVGLIKSILNK